jgi:hypothetical protein
MRTLVLKAAVLFGLCGAVMLWCVCDKETGNSTRRYTVSPHELALDTAFAGGRAAEGELILTNLSTTDLEYHGFFAEFCYVPITWSPTAVTIPAGGSITIAVRFESDRFVQAESCWLDPWIKWPDGWFGENPEGSQQVTVTFAADELEFGEVEVGGRGYDTLTLVNSTLDATPANQFRYEFRNPFGDCDRFPLNQADSVGVIGPGGNPEGSRSIEVRFTPDAVGTFECRRELVSLRVSTDEAPPAIVRACPSEVIWRGTGKISPMQWSACLPGVSGDWRGIYGLSGTEIYVAGASGAVAVSGGDCEWLASGTTFADVDLRDVWGSANGTEKALWAVGNVLPTQGSPQEKGVILKMDGGPWTKVDEDGFHTYSAVWGSGPEDVYFAGTGVSSDFPNAKRWDGNSLSTVKISDWGMSNVSGVSGTGSNDVWAVLEQGFNSVYRFQGSGWEDQTQSFMIQPLHDVWAIQGTGFYAVYAVGADGAIYRYYDDGNASGWTDESRKGLTKDFYGVWVSATGQVFVVGEDQVIYRGQVDEPGHWTLQTPPQDLPAGDLLDVWGAADDDVYAVGNNGVIIRYGLGG